MKDQLYRGLVGELLVTNLVISWLEQLRGCLGFGLTIAVNTFTLCLAKTKDNAHFITTA